MLPTAALLALHLFAAMPPAGDSVPGMHGPRLVTQYRIQRWTDTDGLPQNSIHAVAQTSDRFLWMASEEGLIRFDGVRFTTYHPANTPALQRSQMLALAAADSATLWVGTAGAGLLRHRPGTFTAFTTADGLPADRVQAVAVGTAGAVWAATPRGIARVAADGGITAWSSAQGLPADDVSALLADDAGGVWAGTRAGLAHIAADGTVRAWRTAEGLPAADVRALAAAREGGVWVGSYGGGVARFDGGRFRPLDPRIANEPVVALAEDEDGSLWIGTNGRGLHRYSDGRLETLSNANGGADLIWSLHFDAEGALWVGTNGRGLLQLRQTPFVPFGSAEGLSGEIALAILETRDGSRWIGTAGAGLNRVAPDGTITHFGGGRGLDATMILSLAELPGGDLLVGSLNGSLHRFRDGRFTPLGPGLGLRHSVLAILPDADGGYWLGTTGGVHRVRAGRVAASWTAADGLADDFVMTLHRDARGGIWAGTRQGASRIAGGRVEPGAGTGLEGVAVAAFHERPDGTLWAATQGRGIAQIGGTEVRFLDGATGLCEELIHAIVDDGGGGIWMSSNRGVLRVDAAAVESFFAGASRRVGCTLYDRTEGMRSREANGGFFPPFARTRDGTLLFPTMQGVVLFDPQRMPRAPTASPALLQWGVAGGDTLAFAGPGRVRLPPRLRDLELHFTSPAFRAPDRLRFRFQLVGFDESWRDAGARRAAYYTNLPPGDYTFRVAVSSEDGIWQEAAAPFSVSVPARFHETRAFGIALVLALALAVGVAHRLRVRAIRRNEHRLALLVEERSRAEQRYRDLFENAGDMVFTTDADGRVLSWNAQAEELTGWPKADAVGAHVDALLPGVGSLPGATRRELEFTRRDGEPGTVEITTRPILDGGSVAGHQVIGRDVREWRRMQAQLENAAKMEAVGKLAGGVAHDFNNLLTVITSYSELVHVELPEESPLRGDLEQIRAAAGSAAELTRQLLAFSRQQVLKPRIVDINAQVSRVVSMLRRVIGAHISIDMELTPGIWPIHADAGQLEQVLMNLALNARDAMPDGGTLGLRTTNADVAGPAADRLGLAPGRYVLLHVEDSGTGIDPEVLPRLFEPFYTTKDPGRGTGLGLATVYGVVKQSGGHIVVDSQPGAGTSFRLYLPIAAGAVNADSAAGADGADGTAGSASILLVDDEPAVNRLARKVLARKGYRVLSAAHGSEALRVLDAHGAVDLLLTDVVMPGMSGRELAERVHALFPGTRILYMSGYTEDEVIRSGVLPRGERFIAKPFSPDELVHAVATAVRSDAAAFVHADGSAAAD